MSNYNVAISSKIRYEISESYKFFLKDFFKSFNFRQKKLTKRPRM